MTTIHLSDVQRDQFAACGLIVVDGEPAIPPFMEDKGDNPWFVAPEGWRILTEPCYGCGGAGWVYGDMQRIATKPCTNPDCVGGRRVVTLTANCHPRCCSYGEHAVTLGRFTIPALLPVSYDEATIAGTVYVDSDGVVWLGGEYENNVTLDLDPLPQPGQFIARAVSAYSPGSLLIDDEPTPSLDNWTQGR